MRTLINGFGHIITVTIAIVALIGLVLLLFVGDGSGWMESGFKNLTGAFSNKATLAIDSAANVVTIDDCYSDNFDFTIRQDNFDTAIIYKNDEAIATLTVGDNQVAKGQNKYSFNKGDIVNGDIVKVEVYKNNALLDLDTATYSFTYKYALVVNKSYTLSLLFVSSETELSAYTSSYNSKTLGAVSVEAVYTGFDTATYSSYNEVPWKKYMNPSSNSYYIKNVIVEDELAPVSTAYWFYGFQAVQNIDLSLLDVSKVTDMSYMFYSAAEQKNTGINVNYCTLTITGLENWDTSSVEDMSYMFYNAAQKGKTFTLNLNGWDTSSVKNMKFMFSGVGYNATTLNINGLENWDTSSVEDMSYMFFNAGRSATNAINYNLSNWDVSSVTNMSWMFGGFARGSSNVTLNLTGWDTSSVTNMCAMFDEAGYNATKFPLIGIENWDVSSVTNMNTMLSFCGYKSTDVSLDLSNWDVSSVQDTGYMFEGFGYNAASQTPLTGIKNWDVSSVTNMNGMFMEFGYKATAITLDLTGWDTSSVKNMSSMFEKFCYTSTEIYLYGLEDWTVSSVTNFSQMFYYAGRQSGSTRTCTINLSNWKSQVSSPTRNNFSTYMGTALFVTGLGW